MRFNDLKYVVIKEASIKSRLSGALAGIAGAMASGGDESMHGFSPEQKRVLTQYDKFLTRYENIINKLHSIGVPQKHPLTWDPTTKKMTASIDFSAFKDQFDSDDNKLAQSLKVESASAYPVFNEQVLDKVKDRLAGFAQSNSLEAPMEDLKKLFKDMRAAGYNIPDQPTVKNGVATWSMDFGTKRDVMDSIWKKRGVNTDLSTPESRVDISVDQLASYIEDGQINSNDLTKGELKKLGSHYGLDTKNTEDIKKHLATMVSNNRAAEAMDDGTIAMRLRDGSLSAEILDHLDAKRLIGVIRAFGEKPLSTDVEDLKKQVAEFARDNPIKHSEMGGGLDPETIKDMSGEELINRLTSLDNDSFSKVIISFDMKTANKIFASKEMSQLRKSKWSFDKGLYAYRLLKNERITTDKLNLNELLYVWGAEFNNDYSGLEDKTDEKIVRDQVNDRMNEILFNPSNGERVEQAIRNHISNNYKTISTAVVDRAVARALIKFKRGANKTYRGAIAAADETMGEVLHG